MQEERGCQQGFRQAVCDDGGNIARPYPVLYFRLGKWNKRLVHLCVDNSAQILDTWKAKWSAEQRVQSKSSEVMNMSEIGKISIKAAFNMSPLVTNGIKQPLLFRKNGISALGSRQDNQGNQIDTTRMRHRTEDLPSELR